MSTTSQTWVHRRFVSEPMGNKPVTLLPGIGEALGGRLRQQGFNRASDVLGQFLMMQRDTEMFTKWLKDTSGANGRQARHCARGLSEWCDSFL